MILEIEKVEATSLKLESERCSYLYQLNLFSVKSFILGLHMQRYRVPPPIPTPSQGSPLGSQLIKAVAGGLHFQTIHRPLEQNQRASLRFCQLQGGGLLRCE